MNSSTIGRCTYATVGSAAVLLGLRKRGVARALSVAAGTGLIAYGTFAKSEQNATEHSGHSSQPAMGVVTIGKPRDELYRSLSDPATLSQIFGDAAKVSREGEGRIRVNVSLPGRHEITWTSRLIEQSQGSSFVWRTEPGATVPHEMFLRLRDARPSEWGTIVTLGIAPLSGGKLTKAFTRFSSSVNQAMLTKVLRRFKSLVETGEIPTLSHNPAARHRAFAAI